MNVSDRQAEGGRVDLRAPSGKRRNAGGDHSQQKEGSGNRDKEDGGDAPVVGPEDSQRRECCEGRSGCEQIGP